MIPYKTLMKEATFAQIIEKSRFIGHARPIQSREEGEDFLQKIRQQHREATHNVPVIILGDQMQFQWSSEDGEPQGTAGAPVLKMLVMEELTDLVMVVTRYFGGTKLGTGGLVRAYTSTAKGTLQEAGIGRVVEKQNMVITLEYPYLDKLTNLAAHLKDPEGNPLFQLGNPQYAERVTLSLVHMPEKEGEIQGLLGDLTGGSYQVISRERAYRKEPWQEGEKS
jgi:uncharacterized YigZ family protein